MAKDGKFHIWGFLAALVFGGVIGIIPYLCSKMLNLKSKLWFIPFAFCPPIIGAIIYALSK